MARLLELFELKKKQKCLENFETATRLVFAVIYTAQVVALIKRGRDNFMLFMFQGVTI